MFTSIKKLFEAGFCCMGMMAAGYANDYRVVRFLEKKLCSETL